MNLFHEAKKVLDKDGKVNPLGPHGKSKLTGREISAYFRRNPVKDATIRKAVTVALDLEGAMTTAAKEIKKFYGDKVLKSKEVQFALKYANEGVIHEYKEVSVESVAESLNLLEKAYDANDVKKVQQLEKKFKALLKEVDKTMKGSGISAPAFSMVRGGIRKGLESIEKFYKIANTSKESINEVTQQEVNAVKKLSKDAEKMKKDYFKIAKMGDKELADGKYNSYYESILKMQQKVLSLIGALNNKMRMESTNLMDTYRLIGEQKVEFLEEEKKLKFTNIKDKTLEKHLKVVTKKVGAKLEKISGGFAVSDTDMRGFTAVVDYIFDKSIKKNMLDGGGMSDVTMANENVVMSENYRKLAQKGMGTETKKDARVGLELDYYDSKGNKHMGKITKKTATGYTVQDDKTRKTHTFKFHDRVDAKKLLAASNEFDKNPLKGFPYN